jgi:hypothetical protein
MAPASNENLIQVHERAKLGCLPERTNGAHLPAKPFSGIPRIPFAKKMTAKDTPLTLPRLHLLLPPPPPDLPPLHRDS